MDGYPMPIYFLLYTGYLPSEVATVVGTNTIANAAALLILLIYFEWSSKLYFGS